MAKPLYQKIKDPNRLTSYWVAQIPLCIAIGITGFIYNFGMLASPYFEGRIVDSIESKTPLQNVMILTGIFIGTIAVVLIARALKRYTVRRFANNTTVAMRSLLGNALLHRSLASGEDSSIGSTLSKVISDVEAVVEGMRKLTTEVFDTLVMLLFYIAFLFLYDVEMTLYVLIPVALAILVAFLMRKAIFHTSSDARKANSSMAGMTYDLFDNAMNYRIYGRDQKHLEQYDGLLKDYEKKTVKASALTDIMIPLANVIALLGLIPIFIIAPQRIAANASLSAPIPGLMNAQWSLGAFTTYLTTFILMASKASHTAKLFGSIEKGLASWKRVKPLIASYQGYAPEVEVAETKRMVIRDFSLEIDGKTLLSHFNYEAHQGQIIGITGPIASGKSAFAKTFFQLLPYSGSLSVFGKEVRDYRSEEIAGTFTLMPHHNELFTDTIKNNIALGEEQDVMPYLRDVSFSKDLEMMSEKENTLVGNEGFKLSGGQQERLALARSLYHRKRLLILDDPFASVDPTTEKEILVHLREDCGDSLVLLISHRLTSFKDLDGIIVLHGDGEAEVGKEEELLQKSDLYQTLFALQNTSGKEKV